MLRQGRLSSSIGIPIYPLTASFSSIKSIEICDLVLRRQECELGVYRLYGREKRRPKNSYNQV